MNTQQMEQMGQFKITVWEEENFQGKRCEFLLECQNIMERGFQKIRSIKVENGPWVGFEYPEFQGQQFILEKGDYPRYEAWSGNSSYRTEHMLSFRPIKCANHSDSKVTLYECEDFQGRKFEMCPQLKSTPEPGWPISSPVTVATSTSWRETDTRESTDTTMSTAPRLTPTRSSLSAESSTKST
uniref:Beta-crystallin A2 n=1 Tax=Oncorhynchus tshawytscha TaxID=74940 RepID=A0AAZ3S488_ONCTS